jgi:hypothetical protein
MSTSHKTECRSYAINRAEQDEPIAGANRHEQLADEHLSSGEVTCICSELPS